MRCQAFVGWVLPKGFEVGGGLFDGFPLLWPHGEVIDAVDYRVFSLDSRVDGLLHLCNIADEPLAFWIADMVAAQYLVDEVVVERSTILAHSWPHKDYLVGNVASLVLFPDTRLYVASGVAHLEPTSMRRNAHMFVGINSWSLYDLIPK